VRLNPEEYISCLYADLVGQKRVNKLVNIFGWNLKYVILEVKNGSTDAVHGNSG
jgi:hypothetical protein